MNATECTYRHAKSVQEVASSNFEIGLLAQLELARSETERLLEMVRAG
jgi:hypothetical protein